MSMEKRWKEICDRGKREKPREKPTQTPFRPRNPHGVTETRTRDPAVNKLLLSQVLLNSLDFQLVSEWEANSSVDTVTTLQELLHFLEKKCKIFNYRPLIAIQMFPKNRTTPNSHLPVLLSNYFVPCVRTTIS